MPNGRYREIAEQAMAAGLLPQTPRLIVSNASCTQQEMQWTDIAGLALLSQPEAPAILIVGEVARCPEEVIPAIALHPQQEVPRKPARAPWAPDKFPSQACSTL
jgi:siroheme synthase